MATYSPIFTNSALRKMSLLSLSESTVLDVFNSGQTEKTRTGALNVIKKYPGQEIGVICTQKPTGAWVIISVWKRDRR